MPVGDRQEDPLDRGQWQCRGSSEKRIHLIVKIENPVDDVFEGST